jgi:hypothetical protein
VNSLIYDGTLVPDGCMGSIDNIFPWIVLQFHNIGEAVDFREISFLRIVPIITFLLLLIISSGTANKLAISLVFCLVFGDISNLLYANTLYLEFSVISSCFFAIFQIALLISSKTKTNLINFSILAISILWLGLSKQQYMPLAVALGIFAASLFFLKNEKKFAITLFLISIITPFIYTQMNPDDSRIMRSVSFANKTDVFLWAVLPEASNKEAALSTLGLPKECISGIGKNWFTPDVQQKHPCRKLRKLSRATLIKLFIDDPSTFVQPMRRATIGILPLYPSFLGHLEDASDGNSGKYLFLKKSSLSYQLAKLDEDYFLIFSLISFFLAPVFIMGLTMGNVSEHNRLFMGMIGLGGVVTFYSIFSSVFGDGYSALPKHAVLFLEGVSFQLAGLFLMLMYWAKERISAYRSKST